MHLLPGQAVNLRTGTVVTLLSLNMWWRWQGLGIRRLFCHVEDVRRTTGKMCTAGHHQSLNHADVSALVSTGQTL